MAHFKTGALSPVELLHAVIDRAEQIDVSVNPYADKYFDAARQHARKAEAVAPATMSPGF